MREVQPQAPVQRVTGDPVHYLEALGYPSDVLEGMKRWIELNNKEELSEDEKAEMAQLGEKLAPLFKGSGI